MTIAMPDITAGVPKRKLSWLYLPQITPGEVLPILKEVLVELALGWQHLLICVLVLEIMDAFILGLDVF
jgi:hypothetical protein